MFQALYQQIARKSDLTFLKTLVLQSKYVWYLEVEQKPVIKTTLYLDADILHELALDADSGEVLPVQYKEEINAHFKSVEDELKNLKAFFTKVKAGFLGVTGIVYLSDMASPEFVTMLLIGNVASIFLPRLFAKAVVALVQRFVKVKTDL